LESIRGVIRNKSWIEESSYEETHERKLKRGMRMADLYEPYVFFKGM
jgi:uncharacterized protein YecE (DUF72 family)